MLKKGLLLLLFAAGVLLLVSCGKQAQPSASAPSTTEYGIDAEALRGAEEVAKHDCEIHGHVFSRPTCLQKATCFYCGVQQGELAAHDWTHATCLTRRTCTVCGAQTGDYSAHRFTKATCAGRASCAVCGVTTGGLPAHQFRAATCVSPSMCTVCMQKQGSALGHQWTGGSCTQPKVCTRCKRSIPAPGHKMQGGSCTEDAVCSVCGFTEKAQGHQYVDGVCSVCGKSRLQAAREDETRTTQPASETETTLPALDLEPLNQAAASMRAYLQSAHDDADASISAGGDEGRALAQSAVENLKKALSLAEELESLAKTDARLRAVSDATAGVRTAIKKSAAVSAFYDSTFLKTVTTIRADSTSGLNALSAVEKAIKNLSESK